MSMTGTAETKPEFRALTEAAVLGVLADADPVNRIAAEAMRLVDAYSSFFGPGPVMDREPAYPCWPIETVAMRLAVEAFQEAVMRKAGAGRRTR